MNRPLWIYLPVAAVAALALAAPPATAGVSARTTVEATGSASVPQPPEAVIDTPPGGFDKPLKDHFCGTCV
ncbi:hypothetical protein [Phytohabitans kaempferiae]|uniref:Uncharacterized protein n=1 Tax=Phytohabitans kaempferiae TaxID=1620943 RepID=A0ABV6LWJ2_9ACTN